MLMYETLSQPLIFFIIFSIGLSSGLLFDLKSYINFLFAKNNIISIFLDIVAAFLICLILYFSNLIFNYGEFRFYVLIAFFIGLLIERLSLGIFVAKFFSWCYNKFGKLISKLYGNESKKKEGDIKN